MLTIVEPSGRDEFDAVRQLCWQYRDYLLTLEPEDIEVVQTFYPKDKYDQILSGLERDHCPPNGGVRLVLLDGKPVGCGMYHTLMPGSAEIKRVFVQDSARGQGAARQLMESLIAQCRADGHSRILMDTGKAMVAAQKLHLSMGFHLRGPYQEAPDFVLARLVFFEMDLTAQ